MAPDATRRAVASTASPESGGAVLVREERIPDLAPLFTNPVWQTRFPGVFQATTGRGAPSDPFDLSFFGESAAGKIYIHWRAVRDVSGFPNVAHARQVHSNNILQYEEAPNGILLSDSADGHLTQAAGFLLAVSIADCVPIYLIHEAGHAIALLHAGWRGVAAGILERGIELLVRQTRANASDFHCHFGPAICGQCYEVGPEVFTALGLRAPRNHQPIDLRAILTERATRAGIPASNVSTSAFCTRHDGEYFFSHRGGDRGRQMALLGLRPGS
jgi:polyphenol oxidase